MTETTVHSLLIQKLRQKTASIGIIGLGYVGLPHVMRFSECGYKVLGIDIDSAKVEALNAGKSYIDYIPASSIKEAIARGFEATTDFRKAAEQDALIICVPTPLNPYREPDLSFVLGTLESLLPNLRKGQVVSLESTTYPGTTEEELRPRIEKAGFRVGTDIFLVFSPERVDPGNQRFTTQMIPKVCGGSTHNCLEAGVALYSGVVDRVVPVSSTQTAEMTKLLENIHRAINVGLVNEMKMLCDKMGMDIHEVIRAASTKPYGFTPYYPGPGLGGHCIPIDPFYLTWKARAYGFHTRFIELAGEINSAMPAWVVSKVADALNEHGKSIKGSRLLVLGIAYKKNVDDTRESPAIEILELLTEKGGHVEYSDPHIPVFPKLRKHSFDLKSQPITAQNLAGYDCVVLATDHERFDYSVIRQHSKLIVDTRGVFLEADEHVVKA